MNDSPPEEYKRSFSKRFFVPSWITFGISALTYFGFNLLAHASPNATGIVLLICCVLFCVIFFAALINRLLLFFAPEQVTAYLDEFRNVKGYTFIGYHYEYNGLSYKGLGKARDFDECTPLNTPLTVSISRLKPGSSMLGNPRAGILPPVLMLLMMIAGTLYVASIRVEVFRSEIPHSEPPRYATTLWQGYKLVVPNCFTKYDYINEMLKNDHLQYPSLHQQDAKYSRPIELQANELNISAIGMTKMSKQLPFNSALQSTTLFVENDSHRAIQVRHLMRDNTLVPPSPFSTITIAPGSRCDWPLAGNVPWQFTRGSTVLGVLVSTPETGYVKIVDLKNS